MPYSTNNRIEPIIYTIPLEIQEEALKYQEAVLSNPNIQNTDNYTGYEGKDRYKNGYMGEWAVVQFLQECGLENDRDFFWHPKSDGKSDNGDILIYQKWLDVKVAEKSTAYYTCIYKIPYDANKARGVEADYYINTHKVFDDIEVWGWLKFSDYELSEETFGAKKVWLYKKNFWFVNPIDTFIESILQG